MGDSLKTQRYLRAAVGLLALGAIIFSAMAVVVREGQAVLITRFGRPLRAATQAGLHWKLPWPIDQSFLLDMRRRVYETGHTEMLTRDKKNIIARTFVVWRVGDALAFTQAIATQSDAEGKLDGLLTNAAIGTVKPDEVAVILRWGRLVGATRALQEHGPGLLFAFPQPVDQVVRVQVKRVSEVQVDTLMAGGSAGSGDEPREDEDETPDLSGTLSPLQGYAITGDHNIVHVRMMARYRVREPAEWAFYGRNPKESFALKSRRRWFAPLAKWE